MGSARDTERMMNQPTGPSTGSAWCGWFRPSPLPRRRRKPWVRVAGPGPQDDVWRLLRDHAQRQGGGDTCCLEENRNPNDDKESQ